MLFRKKIERSCGYCVHAAQLEDGQVLCSKSGLKTAVESCRRFRYDPFKRIPPRRKAMDFSKYDQKDFSL